MELIDITIDKLKEINSLSIKAQNIDNQDSFLDSINCTVGKLDLFIDDLTELEDTLLFEHIYYSQKQADIVNKCLKEVISNTMMFVIYRLNDSMSKGEKYFDPMNVQRLMGVIKELRDVSQNIERISESSLSSVDNIDVKLSKEISNILG